MSRKKKSVRPLKTFKRNHDQCNADIYKGQRLDDLLAKIFRSIQLAKSTKGELSDKIWIKQQFAIGVNDVTRVLERMQPRDTTTFAMGVNDVTRVLEKVQHGDATTDASNESSCRFDKSTRMAPFSQLQAVLVAADCKPKWLTTLISNLASSRMVPVILLKDGKEASFRLGSLLNLKTALAVGIKDRGSCINAAFEEIL